MTDERDLIDHDDAAQIALLIKLLNEARTLLEQEQANALMPGEIDAFLERTREWQLP